jgi:hypothetical protein
VEPADIVVLRRVVCCTPVGPSVLGAAASRTSRTLLASYPRDRAGVRIVVRLQNGFLALTRKRFRVFVHSPGALERAAETHGLRRSRVERGIVWVTAPLRIPSRRDTRVGVMRFIAILGLLAAIAILVLQ